MEIAIVDDEANDLYHLKLLIEEYNKRENLFEIFEYINGAELLKSNNQNLKILFLDIDMPQINGIELANALMHQNDSVKIIFITNHISLVTKALNNYGFSFVPKPIDKDDLFMEIDRALLVIKSQSYMLKSLWDAQERHFKVKNIIFIESFNKKCVIHTIDGKEFNSSIILSKYIKELIPYSFIQVHKSYLVNLAHIIKINKVTINVRNYDGELPISRKFKEEFKQKHNLYLNKVLI